MTFLSLLVVGVASAQWNNSQQAMRGKTASPATQKAKTATPVRPQMKSVIWSSNFTNPGDWTIGNSSGNAANWVIANAPSYWWGSLSSTSGGNQAAFDSDGFATAANQIENSGYIQAGPFDFSAEPSVAISFQQFFYKWTGRTFIEVSNNGGLTWVDFEINAGMSNNDQTTDPAFVTVDLTSVLAGSSNALVRILYLSNAISDAGTDHTAGDAWDYGWIVDDVEIGTLPDNDIALVKGWHDDVLMDYEYSKMPLTQTRALIPGVIVQNQGGLPQTVTVTCTISDGTSTVHTSSLNHTSAVGASDTLWFTTGYAPSALGTYTVSYSLPADMDPLDDSYTTSALEMTNFLMAHDYGATGNYGWNPSSADPNIQLYANEPHAWGNIYVPTVNQNAYAIDVKLGTGTATGLYLLARIQQIPTGGSIQDPLTFITQADHTVTAADLSAAKTTIIFPAAAALVAGEAYIVDILKVDGTSGTGFYVGGSGSSFEDDDYSTVCYGPYGTGNAVNYWVGWDFAPYVRLNFDQSLSVKETAMNGVSIYPNPSEGLFKVTNESGKNNLVEVFDVTGKKVYEKTSSSTFTVNLGKQGAGVYLVKVSSEAGSIVERVVIR